MAKNNDNWTMRNAIQIGGFIVLIATILLGAGAIKPSIEENCKEIARVDEKGCQPSMEVRERLVGIDTELITISKTDVHQNAELHDFKIDLGAIKTSLAEMVIEQRHTNEALKRLVGAD